MRTKKQKKQQLKADSQRGNTATNGKTPEEASQLKQSAPAAGAKAPAGLPVHPLTVGPKPSPNAAPETREIPAKLTPPQASTARVAQAPKPLVQAQPAKAESVTPGVSTPLASPRVKVPFVLHEPRANRVWLSGEFNGWSPEGTLMEKHENGYWKTSVELAPGRYQYKFIVDGQWIADPLAHKSVSNPHGTLNSVIEVRV